MRRVMAAERYDITVEQPSKWIVPGLTVIAFVVGLLANTTAAWTYGRRRATIRDRSSGEIVGRFTEPWIVDNASGFGWMLSHLDTMSPSEFERRWLNGDNNAAISPPADDEV